MIPNMNLFLTKIRVNKIYHLQDFDINIADEEKKHLILTGKNGTGKTVLMNEVKLALNRIVSKDKVDDNNIELYFSDLTKLETELQNGNFVMAYYAAERETNMREPNNPQKPDLKTIGDISLNKTDQFLYFLSDYKIQEALARNENQIEEADEINQWFVDFEGLLKELFEDAKLKLFFNYKDYSFRIESQGKKFKFTELSAGYSAVLNIVTDLILKMQQKDSLTRVYNKQGIVLIDEIETHLHLELQRVILPMLTRIFPNIQFIITTHSPFILNSLENVIAFDLETKEAISDLSNYSYEALAEGYFGVKTESGTVGLRIERMRALISQEKLSIVEQIELKELIADFEKLPEFAAPSIKAAYQMLRLEIRKKGWPL